MKRMLMLLFVIGLLGLATGCGNNNTDGTKNKEETNQETKEEKKEVKSESVKEDVEEEKGQNVTEQTVSKEDEDYMKSKMEALDFSEIKVEVKYAEDKEYEFKIEQDKMENEPIEAEVEDELNNVFLKGRKAFDDIYPKIENLDVKSDSTEQDVVDKILTAFDLPTDYEKMEVDITFNDGKELDFDHRK
ncbi:YusW family protein [Pseudogracilibacillus auburnensis]|uniref:YusW family protein n=1 Tax=Pseudogracilibacillus auburnensis TaxID=1494959 RepID=UPI001A9628DB|nr:YusW family protein [Pseudogracilibacillus auburnensis]MBO1001609.1 hypothetical protein [Pseudogracilibacillus auburnensis]